VNPNVYIIAGPNGAGKTTFAREFLPNYANCRHFVNADLIATGLSPFSPEAAAFRAGRLMLREISRLAQQGADFGFETTLSGRSYAQLLQGMKRRGYQVHFFYLWIPSVSLALSRIRERVALGGHDVPTEIVQRRFTRSLESFLARYRPLADSWMLFDNSGRRPAVIAAQEHGQVNIVQRMLYNAIVAWQEGL
jgi:predicted ABC-type ATPase